MFSLFRLVVAFVCSPSLTQSQYSFTLFYVLNELFINYKKPSKNIFLIVYNVFDTNIGLCRAAKK